MNLKRIFLALIPIIAFLQVVSAQDIPLKQENSSTYSFSLDSYIIIKDFEIPSITASQSNENKYDVRLNALDEDKNIDTEINGKLLFEANGELIQVPFYAGIGEFTIKLENTDELELLNVDSGIKRTVKIPQSYKTVGIILLIIVIPLLLLGYRFYKRKAKHT